MHRSRQKDPWLAPVVIETPEPLACGAEVGQLRLGRCWGCHALSAGAARNGRASSLWAGALPQQGRFGTVCWLQADRMLEPGLYDRANLCLRASLESEGEVRTCSRFARLIASKSRVGRGWRWDLGFEIAWHLLPGCQQGRMAAAERSDEETEGSADEDFEEPSLDVAASDEASEVSEEASEQSGSLERSRVVLEGIEENCHVLRYHWNI